MAYPTPPPTISPQNEFHYGSKMAAQDSYFNSAPDASMHQYAAQGNGSDPVPMSSSLSHSQTTVPYRISSPLIPSKIPLNPDFQLNYTEAYAPIKKPSARTPPPRPIFFSPTNSIPTPYNSSRPIPRPGFRKRAFKKIASWCRSIARWIKKNPWKAGFCSFLPVLIATGLPSAFSSIGKMFGKGKTGFENFVQATRKSVALGEKEKKAGVQSWGPGLNEFIGFNGSKGSPIDGMMKILQMWVTHICRVSPSMVPRTMAIILELYFLELKK